MAEEKKFSPTFQPTFKVKGTDCLSKDWFIEFYDEYGKRQKRYEGINKHTTYEARMQAAKSLIIKLSEAYQQSESLQQRAFEFIGGLKLRRKSQQSYESIVRVFLRGIGQQAFTREAVHAFFAARRQVLHGKTFNNTLMVLTEIFSGIGYRAYFEGIAKVRGVKSTPKRRFSNTQKAQLSEYIRNRDYTLWMFMQFVYYCFIRPQSELRLLKVENIILEDDQIEIPAYLSKNDTARFVEIPNAFKPALVKYLEGKQPTEYLFPSKLRPGKPMGKDITSRQFRAVLRDLGYVGNYSMYGWKHTGNLRALRAGATLDELQRQNGHATIAQTATYLNSIGAKEPSRLKKVMPEF